MFTIQTKHMCHVTWCVFGLVCVNVWPKVLYSTTISYLMPVVFPERKHGGSVRWGALRAHAHLGSNKNPALVPFKTLNHPRRGWMEVQIWALRRKNKILREEEQESSLQVHYFEGFHQNISHWHALSLICSFIANCGIRGSHSKEAQTLAVLEHNVGNALTHVKTAWGNFVRTVCTSKWKRYRNSLNFSLSKKGISVNEMYRSLEVVKRLSHCWLCWYSYGTVLK